MLMKLKQIEKIDCDSFLYDIETKKHHNFFAEGILVHNSSCTIYTNFKTDVAAGYYEMGVCSRNFELKLEGNETNAFIMAATREGWFEHLPKLSKSIAIQAELCGPGIQGNPYKLSECKLFVFDIWFIKERRYATRLERKDILLDLRNLGVKVSQVPHLGTIDKLPDTLDEILSMADGKSKECPIALREGIVFKTYELDDGRVNSFKAISNQFLLKQK